MIRDLGHLAFRVSDIDRALAFYAELGIREAFRLHHDDGSLMLVYLHVAGDRFVELFPGGEGKGEPRGSFRHLCLLTDDLQGAVATLRGKGIAIEEEPKRGLDGNLQAWVKDPDGNPIELMELDEDSPQRRTAALGGD